MSKGRRGKSQHTKESERDDKQVIRDLKSQNRHLEKQIKQLEKQLKIHQCAEPDYPEINKEPARVNKEVIICQKCKSRNTSQIQAGVYFFTLCNDCGAKRRSSEAVR